MSLPVVLAHGSLGSFDELIFLGVAIVFLVVMGISWVRSRMTQPDLDSQEDSASTPETESSERFKLD